MSNRKRGSSKLISDKIKEQIIEDDSRGNSIPMQDQEISPKQVPEKEEEEHDLDLPITIRKGKRACTRHPTCNYVSYDKVSPQL